MNLTRTQTAIESREKTENTAFPFPRSTLVVRVLGVDAGINTSQLELLLLLCFKDVQSALSVVDETRMSSVDSYLS